MNQFHIYDQIGKGRHSAVYKGRRKKTLQYFAIKSVDKAHKAAIFREVRIFHALEHENVLKFHSWYETKNHLWLILEYCVGGDLHSLLKKDGRLPEDSVRDFARDLAEGLQFLHSQGIVFGDLRPANVLLDENGRLKLARFSLAQRFADLPAAAAAGEVHQGSPAYLAPELFVPCPAVCPLHPSDSSSCSHACPAPSASSVPATARLSFASDLWALGCLLYECLAGHPPFPAASPAELLAALLSAEPSPPLPAACPAAASPALADLLARLLCKDPRRRIAWPELRQHAFWQGQAQAQGGEGGEGRGAALSSRPLPASGSVPLGLQDKRQGGEGGTKPGAPAAAQGAEADACEGQESRKKAAKHEGTTGIGCTDVVSEGAMGEAATGEFGSKAQLEAGSAAGGEAKARVPSRQEGEPTRAARAPDAERAVAASGRGQPEAPAAQQPEPSSRPTAAQGSGSPKGPTAAMHQGTCAGATPLRLRRSSCAARYSGSSPHASSSLSSAAIELDLCSGAAEEAGAEGGPADAGAGGGLECSAGSADEPDDGARVPLAAGAPAEEAEEVPPAPPVRACDPALAEWCRAVAPLLWCPAEDDGVTPILQNRRIETLPAPSFDRHRLPVAALSAEQLLALAPADWHSDAGAADGSPSAVPPELSRHLACLLTVLSGPAPVGEKAAVLRYLQALAGSGAPAASVLLRCPAVLPALVRCLQGGRGATLRAEAATAVGLLLRNCQGEGPLAQGGVLQPLAGALCSCAREREAGQAGDRLRRRAVAALGELLFLWASTAPEGVARAEVGADEEAGREREGLGTRDACVGDDAGRVAACAPPKAGRHWAVLSECVGLLLQVLRRSEDEVSRHYAAKAAENLASLGPQWVQLLLAAAPDALPLLCRLLAAPGAPQQRSPALPTSPILKARPAPPFAAGPHVASPFAPPSPPPAAPSRQRPSDGLRATACACLVHVLRHCPSAAPQMLALCGGLPALAVALSSGCSQRQLMLGGAASPASNELTAELNLLNLCLLACAQETARAPGQGAAASVEAALPALVPALRLLWDAPRPLLRAKALLSGALLLQAAGAAALPALCCEGQLPAAVERARREAARAAEEDAAGAGDTAAACLASSLPLAEAAVRRAAALQLSAVAAGVAALAASLEAQRKQIPLPEGQRGSPLWQQAEALADGVQVLAEALLLVVASPLRPAVLCHSTFSTVGRCLEILAGLLEAHPSVIGPCARLLSSLLQPLDAACQFPSSLRSHAPALCRQLLPSVAALYCLLAAREAPPVVSAGPADPTGTAAGSGSAGSSGSRQHEEGELAAADARFMCAKLLCDCLPLLLPQAHAPSGGSSQWPAGGRLSEEPVGGSQGAEEQQAALLVRDLVRRSVLPLYPCLLADTEPLPSYAEKLLAALLDHGAVSMEEMAQEHAGVAAQCFQRLASDPACVGMHTLRLTLLLTASPAMAPLVRQQLPVLPGVAALLASVVAADSHEYTDPVVSLCLLLLEMAVEDLGSAAQDEETWGGAVRAEVVAVVPFAPVFLQLTGHPEALVADIAADCLQLLLAVQEWHVARTLLPSLHCMPALFRHNEEREDDLGVQDKVSRLLVRLVHKCVIAATEELSSQGQMANELLAEPQGGTLVEAIMASLPPARGTLSSPVSLAQDSLLQLMRAL